MFCFVLFDVCKASEDVDKVIDYCFLLVGELVYAVKFLHCFFLQKNRFP